MRRILVPAAMVSLLLINEMLSAEPALTLKENLAVMNCAAPNDTRRFVGSSAAGHLFLPSEPVKVQLQFKEDTPGDVFVELQEITTRANKRVEGMEGFTDTGGHAHIIGTEGQPLKHQIQPQTGDAFEVQLPLPERFGTYALILTWGDKRQFLGTVCRVPQPKADSTLENTPIFGEFSFFDRDDKSPQRAEAYRRMGIRGMRLETSWNENQDGNIDWSRLDRLFSTVESAGIQMMVTLGGHGGWQWPFGPHKQTPASVAPEWDGNPYWGQADWVCDPKLYPRYGKWITAFCERYWKGGKGALWGLENYNEPWEGGGISGWARDCVQYKEIQKLIAESARKVDPKIVICAASSIMNTEDKFYTDGSNEMDKYVDVFTDHYVVPCMSYGPMVAAAHGKQSAETETWFVNAEYMLPQIVQFLASGQKRLSPWHPRVLYEAIPGSDDNYNIPTPLVAATAAFNRMVAGKPFEKIAFHTHLPWVFQFGKDNDPDGMLVVLGQLITIGGTSVKERLWAQVEGAEGGTLTIDNADGQLKFFDLAGNPAFVGQKSVTVPMSILPLYVSHTQGPAAAAEQVKNAYIEGKRPVEILPHDFATRVNDPKATLDVTLHNCLNRAVTGQLAVVAPQGISLKASDQKVELKAGESKRLSFPLASAATSPANAYPFQFKFTSDAGNAEYAEVMNASIIVKGTKTVDGNLDDWNDVPGLTVVAAKTEGESTEKLRRPWLELKDQLPDGTFGEFKLAWDENNLYVAGRVFDQTPSPPTPKMAGRDENDYFHSKKSDTRAPYDKFLKDFPGRSFAEVPYVYADSPENPRQAHLPKIHFRRDRLHIALDVTDDWGDLKRTSDRVPVGFHAVPDTDYEYALYACSGGESECWRLTAPGVPRIHDFPRAKRGERTTGPVLGAKHFAKQDGKAYVYELAIPRDELAKLELKAGTNLGLMLRGGNDNGPHVDYGLDKAVCKSNGLTLKPYWERESNCGVRWTLVE